MSYKKKIEDIFEITAQPTVDIVSSIFLEGMVGAVVPGVTSAVMAYRQKRTEKMIELFMLETKKRHAELEEKLLSLNEESIRVFKDKHFGLVLDYVADNKQEEKIKYIVNGFIKLASPKELKEDIVLIYYDILEQLNMLDIRVLMIHNNMARREGYYEILTEAEITHDQYKLIQNKLERLGLIETAGQSQYDEMFDNVKNLGQYLLELEKGKKAKLKFKKPKPGGIKHYKLTRLGWEFFDFFMENEH